MFNKLKPIISDIDISRFWSHINILSEGECWLWNSYKGRDGYGRFSLKNKLYRSHVLAKFLDSKVWPYNLLTCHTCDTPLCCNPSHLWLGTSAENIADRDVKGRTTKGDNHWTRTNPEKIPRGDKCGARLHPETRPRGENSKLAKILESDVLEIRRLRIEDNLTISKIASMYGLGESQTSRIIKRQSWKHV